jgi:hypothetical protein
MRESVFLNKNEMVSFYSVDVEIGRGAGDFLYILYFKRQYPSDRPTVDSFASWPARPIKQKTVIAFHDRSFGYCLRLALGANPCQSIVH